MNLSLIVAMTKNHVIGKDNQMPWHLPADLAWFRQNTTGKPVIMGRKTFESLGHPLPNRNNIIITQNKEFQATGCTVVHHLDDALTHAKDYANSHHHDEIYIIGGGQIYQKSLDLADILEITHVDLEIDGDAFYPDFSKKFTQIWKSDIKQDEKTGIKFYFARYQKQS
mgnify:CR=1 FL=1